MFEPSNNVKAAQSIPDEPTEGVNRAKLASDGVDHEFMKFPANFWSQHSPRNNGQATASFFSSCGINAHQKIKTIHWARNKICTSQLSVPKTIKLLKPSSPSFCSYSYLECNLQLTSNHDDLTNPLCKSPLAFFLDLLFLDLFFFFLSCLFDPVEA
ncbi:hypothetical protein Y032_0646g1092 [Ancylostoma ceylanicum]|uniref:Uncharacterized protein n=1 Tax=Ancylostoma ceylanicum TaxID=53326 RepID=A0A016WK71_9BILA|nr:hypothetical protein Y032_0646g1092 [Ancylostoma ceylanicum]